MLGAAGGDLLTAYSCAKFKLQITLNGYRIAVNCRLDRVTHICVSNLTIIGSENGSSSGRCQTIIWTNGGILLIGLSEV